MALDTSFRDFILDQLSGLDGVTAKRMFGGFGLYRETVFFGILHRDRLYFRTDAETRRKYIEEGMAAFQPRPGQTLKHYFEVPLDIVEDRDRLREWAIQAAQCQHDPRKENS